MSSGEFEVETFAKDVVRLASHYTDEKLIAFFRTKIDVSSTRRETSVILEPCRPGAASLGGEGRDIPHIHRSFCGFGCYFPLLLLS